MREAKTAHTPRKRGPKTEAGKAKSLMNLVQNQEATQLQEIEAGTRQRLYKGREYSGVHSIDINQPATKKLAEQINGILEGDSSAFIKPCDRITVNLLAVCLRRIQQIEQYLDKVGSMTNKRGAVRPIVEYLVKLLREAREYCNSLGLSPTARAKLGADSASMLNTVSSAEQQALRDLMDKNPELEQMAMDLYRRAVISQRQEERPRLTSD